MILVLREAGGRGHTSLDDSVDASIQPLEDYIDKRGKELITPVRKNTDKTKTIRMTISRKQKWEEKQLNGRFKRLIKKISLEKTRTWQRKGNLKREIESHLIAVQNNTIRTNNIKAKIDKTQQNSKCWLCGYRDETINHTISECSKLAQQISICPGEWDI